MITDQGSPNHAAGSSSDMLPVVRHDWRAEEVEALFALPFSELLHRAHSIHRCCFDPNEVQLSTLLSVKTGGCPEDCAYCPQSAHYETGVGRRKLMDVEEVVAAARMAKEAGATRFCMGAAWRSPREADLDRVVDMIGQVKALGLETCATLGLLTAAQALRLQQAGLDYYNHNIDTSEAYYSKIISTRRFADRIETLAHVRDAGMKVCCGGIVGMGESRSDRAGMLRALANLPQHPESVPVNMLVQVPGTPLDGTPRIDSLEFVRTIAVARVLMPQARVRLSAGRDGMSDELQALCFFAGANSIFYGEKLLTTGNAAVAADGALFERLGIRALADAPASDAAEQPAGTGTTAERQAAGP